MIYMDNAATTSVREEVIEAMLPIYRELYGNPSSSYKIGQKAASELKKARDTIARLLGAESGREIYFTSCGTESDNWAIKGAAYAMAEKGRHIITSRAEHHAVGETCEFLESQGWEVTYLDVDKYGMVSPESVEAAIRPDTVLISVMLANNEVGTINPIAEISAIAKKHGVLMHTDAVQAVGHIPVNIRELGVDMLSLSGHKFHAPKGVGALYIRNGVTIAKYMNGGAQERNRRAGTENVAGIVGMAKALELACSSMAEDNARMTELRDHMIEQILSRLDHTHLNGHPTKRLPGNVNISFEYVESEATLLLLDIAGIACSSGSACNAGAVDSSHVLLAMGIPNEVAKGAHRFSFSSETTREDVDFTIEKVIQVVEKIRSISPVNKFQKYDGAR